MATRVLADYSPEQIERALRALEANHGNAKKTAAEQGIPRTTLREWAGRAGDHTRARMHKDASEEERGALAQTWRRIAEKNTKLQLKALDHIDPAKLKASDLKHLAVQGAVATDKDLLLTGGVTQRHSVSIRVSLVAPGALKGLTPGVIEGDYRTVAEGEGPAEDAPVRS